MTIFMISRKNSLIIIPISIKIIFFYEPKFLHAVRQEWIFKPFWGPLYYNLIYRNESYF